MEQLRIIEKPISYFLSNERVITSYTTRNIFERFEKRFANLSFLTLIFDDFQSNEMILRSTRILRNSTLQLSRNFGF